MPKSRISGRKRNRFPAQKFGPDSKSFNHPEVRAKIDEALAGRDVAQRGTMDHFLYMLDQADRLRWGKLHFTDDKHRFADFARAIRCSPSQAYYLWKLAATQQLAVAWAENLLRLDNDLGHPVPLLSWQACMRDILPDEAPGLRKKSGGRTADSVQVQALNTRIQEFEQERAAAKQERGRAFDLEGELKALRDNVDELRPVAERLPVVEQERDAARAEVAELARLRETLSIVEQERNVARAEVEALRVKQAPNEREPASPNGFQPINAICASDKIPAPDPRAQADRFYRLICQGWNVRQIAAKLDYPVTHVSRMLELREENAFPHARQAHGADAAAPG